MARYKSRAKRCSDIANTLTSIAECLSNKLQEFEAATNEEERDVAVEVMEAEFQCFDTSEIDSLKDEMESWRDGMQGTNLENTGKFEEVSECCDALDQALDTLGGIEEPDWEAESDDLQTSIQEVVEQLETGASELEEINFPGMY